VTIATALQLEGCLTSRQSHWAVLGHFCTAHAHKLLILSFL